MVEKISMSVDDTLELDYLVEKINDNTIDVTEPNGASFSLDYGQKKFGIFDPSDPGTYMLDIDSQTIEIQVTDIPDSVLYQYPVSTFTTSTWNDNVGSADMSVNGMVADTFSNGEDSVFGDGTDDVGTATAPATIPENQTFGLAFSCEYSSTAQFSRFFGADDGTNAFGVFRSFTSGGSDTIAMDVTDSNVNRLTVETDNAYDGSPRAVVINKTDNTGSGVDIYIDDMSTAVSTTVQNDQGFDHSSYSNGSDMGFFARDGSSGNDLYGEGDIGIFEFNSQPYSQSERDDFVARRPEV